MTEAANILGVLAAGLLLVAVIAWTRLLRGPSLRRADGGTEMDSAQGEVASELLFWAAGLSGAAAFLALAGWIFA
jgi:hypothetical protein